MRIFLLGFMGSGKSMLGRQLAEKLRYSFVDLDEIVEKKAGKSIASLFEQQGERFFRQQEADCLRETAQHENAVVATGGGTPCFHDNMMWLNKNGTTIYLKLLPVILFERLLPMKNNRPLIAHLENYKLKSFIEEKLKEREKFYLQSAFIIENPTLEKILSTIPNH